MLDRQRTIFERRYAKAFSKALREQLNSVLKIEDYSTIGQRIELVVKEDPIIDVFSKLYPDVGVWYAVDTNRKLRKRLGKSDGWTDIWFRTMQTYGLTEAGQRITWITEASRALILDIIRTSFAEINTGIGISQATDIIHRELKKRYGKIERWRAMRIANTEVHTAANRGSLAGVEALGVPYRKVWLVGGRNIRPTHQALNGTSVGQHEDFNVGLSRAKYPGDARLPAEESINCKCTLLYEPIEN